MGFEKKPDRLNKAALGKRCQEARLSANLTQKQMAEMMGYSSPSVVSSKEQGHNYPSVEDVYFLSQMSGCSIDWLVAGERDDDKVCCQSRHEVSLLREFRLLTDFQKSELVFYLMRILRRNKSDDRD